MKYYLKEIVKIIESNYLIEGNILDPYITNAKTISDANDRSIVFIDINRDNKNNLLKNTTARIIICDKNIDIQHAKPYACLIIVNDPKLIFATIVNKYFIEKPDFSIHPTAVIHSQAKLNPNILIGPNSYIGNSEIGEGSIIYGNSYIYDNVKIGSNVIIHAGCIIGSEGFGFLRNDDMTLINFPHIGGVIIEDDVEIQALTHISRGALGNTIIGKGSKINSGCHIAHNDIIGKNNVIGAHASFSGSVKLGDNNYIGPSSAIRDQLSIGNNNFIGMASVVTKNIDNDQIWAGNPARKLSQLKKLQKIFNSLLNE